MEQTVIKLAGASDIAQLSAQIAQSYQAAYQNLMDSTYLDTLTDAHWVPILQEGLLHGDTCLMLEVGGQLAGSAVFGKAEAAPNSAALHAIYLSPAYIGRGLGHLLYCKTEQTMCAQGYNSSTLEVLSGNHRAIRFYQAHGYTVVGSFTVQENGMQLHCHTMRKALQG